MATYINNILDSGFFQIGTASQTQVLIPGLTSVTASVPTTGTFSLLQDNGLFTYGYNFSGVIYIPGLTTSNLGTTGPSASIFDSGMYIIGYNDPINHIVSIPHFVGITL